MKLLKNKAKILSSILLFLLIINCTGCLNQDQKREAKIYERNSCENAISFIKNKYGFKPEIYDVKAETTHAEFHIYDSLTKNCVVYMKHKNKKFQVFADGSEPGSNSCADNYQYDKVKKDLLAAIKKQFKMPYSGYHIEYGLRACDINNMVKPKYINHDLKSFFKDSLYNITDFNCKFQSNDIGINIVYYSINAKPIEKVTSLDFVDINKESCPKLKFILTSVKDKSFIEAHNVSSSNYLSRYTSFYSLYPFSIYLNWLNCCNTTKDGALQDEYFKYNYTKSNDLYYAPITDENDKIIDNNYFYYKTDDTVKVDFNNVLFPSLDNWYGYEDAKLLSKAYEVPNGMYLLVYIPIKNEYRNYRILYTCTDKNRNTKYDDKYTENAGKYACVKIDTRYVSNFKFALIYDDNN